VVLLRQLPGVSFPLSLATLLNVVLGALLPLASTVTSGLLVGRIPAAVRGGLGSPAGRSMEGALAILAGLYAVQFTIVPLLQQAVNALGRRLDRSISNRVMAAVLAPTGIRHLEDPAMLDEVTKTEGLATGYTPGGALRGMTGMWTARLGGVGGVVLISRFAWWLALVLAVVALGEQRYWRTRFDEVTRSVFNRGDLHRRSSYLRDVSLTPIAAKEVRVFDLQPWLARRFHESWTTVMAPVWKDMRGKPLMHLVAVAVPMVAIPGALALIATAALDGRISLTAAVVFAQAVFSVSQITSATTTSWYRVVLPRCRRRCCSSDVSAVRSSWQVAAVTLLACRPAPSASSRSASTIRDETTTCTTDSTSRSRPGDRWRSWAQTARARRRS